MTATAAARPAGGLGWAASKKSWRSWVWSLVQTGATGVTELLIWQYFSHRAGSTMWLGNSHSCGCWEKWRRQSLAVCFMAPRSNGLCFSVSLRFKMLCYFSRERLWKKKKKDKQLDQSLLSVFSVHLSHMLSLCWCWCEIIHPLEGAQEPSCKDTQRRRLRHRTSSQNLHTDGGVWLSSFADEGNRQRAFPNISSIFQYLWTTGKTAEVTRW